MEKFQHRKSLGQNFLKARYIIAQIIASIYVKSEDLIIEIGPGEGDLTEGLQCYDAPLICYEIDKRLEETLKKYSGGLTKIIFEDFLQADIKKDIKDIPYNDLYIIANLPYYITTPIIEKIIGLDLDVKAMVLMVQKEVGKRFCAAPGNREYGSITVYLNYYFDIEYLFTVDKSAFEPQPKIDSAVIKLSRKEKRLLAKDEVHFFKLVKDAFTFKRKNLRNNLMNYDLETVEKVLGKHDLNLQSRAEAIPLEVFIELSNELISKF